MQGPATRARRRASGAKQAPFAPLFGRRAQQLSAPITARILYSDKN